MPGDATSEVAVAKTNATRRGDRARIFAFAFLGLAVLGVFGWYLARNLESREERVWVGYHGEARTDAFLAASRLLNRLGRETHPVRGIPITKTLGKEDALILPDRRLRLTPGQVKDLVAWVRSGGLLIAEGTYAENADSDRVSDPLFDAFQARLVATDLKAPTIGDKEAPEDFKARRKAFEQEHGVFDLTVNGVSCKADLGGYDRLENRRPGADASEERRVLGREEGSGLAVLFTHLYALDNRHLADEDHADLLAALVSKRPVGAKVWIVYQEEPPSLLAWLRANAWMVLIAFGALLVVGLWRALRRIGPRLPDPPLARRSLLEHLAATGRFLGSVRDGEALLAASQAAFRARLGHAHPALAALPPDDLVLELAKRAAIPEMRVFKALRYGRLSDPRDFTEAIQTLELLRNLP